MTEVTFGDYLVGSIELSLVAVALGLGAWRLRALLLPGWSGASARVAEVVLALSMLVVVLELVGVVGLYRPGWVLTAAVATGLGVAWVAGRRAAPSADRGLGRVGEGSGVGRSGAESQVMLLVAIGAALLVAAHWAVPTQEALDIGMYRPNSTWHNMPFATRFVQDAQVGSLLFTEPLRLTVWFYPQNSELLHSSGILFLGTDFLSPLINMGFLALCLLAAWSFGRPYGVGAAALVGVALVLDSDMLLLYQPGDAKNDTPGLFFILAAVAVLVNGEAWRRSSPRGAAGAMAGGAGGPAEDRKNEFASEASRSEAGSPAPPASDARPAGPAVVVIAGLAAGLALGTKLNLLAPVGALTVGVIAIAAAGTRIRTGAIWVGSMLVTGGFWFARNLVEAGNPLPWLDRGPLPGPDQLDLNPREPHTVADYLTNKTVISDWLIPGLHDSFGPMWPELLALMLGGIVLAIWRASTPTLRMLAFVAGFAAIAYLFTPLTAAGREGMPDAFVVNVRYLSPSLAIGAMLFAVDPQLRRGHAARAMLAILSGLLLLTALPSDVWQSRFFGGAVVLAALVVGVPVALFLAARRGVPRLALAIAAVAALGVAIGIGWPQQRDYLRDRYVAATAPDEFPAGVLTAMAWTKDADLHDQRIAVVGAREGYKQYVFYGDDLSNHVQYVGHHGPHGALRPITGCEEWRRSLNDGDYDYVVAGPAHESQSKPPIESTWTGSDPAARLIQEDEMVSVFALSGDLDPAGCPT